MVRASEKMHVTTFVDFDICHRMAQLRKLYSVTLPYYFKVNNLKRQYLGKGDSERKNV